MTKPKTQEEKLDGLLRKRGDQLAAVMPVLTEAMVMKTREEVEGRTPTAGEAADLTALIDAMPKSIMDVIKREREAGGAHPVGNALGAYVVYKTQVAPMLEGAEAKAKNDPTINAALGFGFRAETSKRLAQPKIDLLKSRITDDARDRFAAVLIGAGLAADSRSANALIAQVDRALPGGKDPGVDGCSM